MIEGTWHLISGEQDDQANAANVHRPRMRMRVRC
jgi:hypothetical protein